MAGKTYENYISRGAGSSAPFLWLRNLDKVDLDLPCSCVFKY
jgi:hypothetical protein